MTYSANELVWRSRQHILDMLEYRGFDTSSYQNFCKEELDVLANQNSLNILVDHREKEESCLVNYIKQEKLGQKKLKDILGDRGDGIYDEQFGMFSEKNIEDGIIKSNTKTVILILIGSEVPALQKIVNSYYNYSKKEKKNVYVQIFEIKKLCFNILKHSLVPKHEVITEEEFINEVQNVYKINSKSQLPGIKRDDPVAKYIGIRPEQVCRITRPSESSGVYICYRYCKT